MSCCEYNWNKIFRTQIKNSLIFGNSKYHLTWPGDSGDPGPKFILKFNKMISSRPSKPSYLSYVNVLNKNDHNIFFFAA